MQEKAQGVSMATESGLDSLRAIDAAIGQGVAGETKRTRPGMVGDDGRRLCHLNEACSASMPVAALRRVWGAASFSFDSCQMDHLTSWRQL